MRTLWNQIVQDKNLAVALGSCVTSSCLYFTKPRFLKKKKKRYLVVVRIEGSYPCGPDMAHQTLHTSPSLLLPVWSFLLPWFPSLSLCAGTLGSFPVLKQAASTPSTGPLHCCSQCWEPSFPDIYKALLHLLWGLLLKCHLIRESYGHRENNAPAPRKEVDFLILGTWEYVALHGQIDYSCD